MRECKGIWLKSGICNWNLNHSAYNTSSGNTHADSLATLVTSLAQNLPRVILIEDLCKPSGIRENMICVPHVRIGLSWMDPIIQYLSKDVLLEDKSEAEKIRRKTPQFWLSEDQKLYKRSFSGPYLLCIHPAITQGYWWPNMQNKTLKYAKKCDQCQRFAPNTHQLGGFLNPLSSPWPFAQWGLDIVGLFPKAARNKKYLLVGTNYFTKWVEAEPLVNI